MIVCYDKALALTMLKYYCMPFSIVEEKYACRANGLYIYKISILQYYIILPSLC